MKKQSMEAKEEQRARLIVEEEMRNYEEIRLKAEEEEQARLKAEEHSRLVEDARQEAK